MGNFSSTLATFIFPARMRKTLSNTNIAETFHEEFYTMALFLVFFWSQNIKN